MVFGNFKIFSKPFYKFFPKAMAQEIQNDITDEIAYHKYNINRPKAQKSQGKNGPTNHGDKRPLKKTDYHYESVNFIMMRDVYGNEPLLHFNIITLL